MGKCKPSPRLATTHKCVATSIITKLVFSIRKKKKSNIKRKIEIALRFFHFYVRIRNEKIHKKATCSTCGGLKCMRVIAGECKGRPLKSVPGLSTRPTADKVKEALFNMVGPYFEGGFGLDLYAGSGALGIEALSRGLDKVVFVDRDYRAVQTIKENVERCGYSQKAETFCNDAKLALKALKKRGMRFSLIMLDPPYQKQRLVSEIDAIQRDQLLMDEGYIVVEHTNQVALPTRIGRVIKKKEGAYGKTMISIFACE